MGRRSPGDGSVYFDASRGMWVGSIDLGRDPQTGRRRRPKVSAPTKTEAKALLDALKDEKRRTGTVGRRDVTVETVVRSLQASRPASWRSEITVRVNGRHADRIIAAIGKRRLAKLTATDVEVFLASLATVGLARKTIADTKRILAWAIRRAERDGLVGRNVADLAEMPGSTVRRSRSMTLEQVRALLRSDMAPLWRAYVTAGIMCGLRPGELLGLRWRDVDFAGGLLRVRKSMKENGELGELKTPQSHRTLVMPAAVAAALRALKADQAAAKLRAGRGYADRDLVFAMADGRPVRRQRAGTGLKRVTGRAGIGDKWQPRELRHTFVSVLSDAGVDIEVIADSVGHVSANVTRAVYRHQIADKVSAAAQAMDRVFGTGSAS
jgi:integrase